MKTKINDFKKLNESLSKQIAEVIGDGLSYSDFAIAVAEVIKEEYGSHNIEPFLSKLKEELIVTNYCPECTAGVEYDDVLGTYKCTECEWEGQFNKLKR